MIDQNLRIAGVIDESIVDGPGIRFVIFTQGCPHHCPGCHNPQTHDFEAGREVDTEEILAMIRKNPLLDGLTLTGGETVTVNLADLVDTYTGQNGATVNVAIAANGQVSASVNVSAQSGNIIEARADGIYAGVEWQTLA